MLFIAQGREVNGIPTFVVLCGMTQTILRTNFPYKIHSLHYGETPSRTGGETGGDKDGDGQLGRCSSIQRFTCRSQPLLQVYGCFGSSDGSDRCGSGFGLHLSFCHVYTIIQTGEKYPLALIEIFSVFLSLGLYPCIIIYNQSACLSTGCCTTERH